MSTAPLVGLESAQQVPAPNDAAAHGPTRRDADAGARLSTRGLRTRTALLASARELFSARGYQSTTVALIAQHAGVSLGTYYQYFADRSDILSELVADAVADLSPTRSKPGGCERESRGCSASSPPTSG